MRKPDRSPASLGGKNTQRVHVRIERGIDEHCTRSRQAGARIVKEPEDQFYGERTYIAAAQLQENGFATAEEIQEIRDEARKICIDARKKALSDPMPTPDREEERVYA